MRAMGLAVLCLAFSMPAQLAPFQAQYAEAEQQRLAGKLEVAAYKALYQRALRSFLKIPQDDPAYRGQLPAAGFAAFLVEDFEGSARLFADALAKGGKTAFLVEYRLRALAQSKDLSMAVREARRFAKTDALAVDRFLVAAYSPVSAYAGVCLRQGQREIGLWCFRGLVRATQDHALALANLALALRYLGEFEESGALYARAVLGAPKDSVLWNDYGIFYKAWGKRALALSAFRRSIELETKAGNSAAWTNMMFLWRNDKELIEDARAAFRKLLRARPQQTLRRRLAIDAILAGQLRPANTSAVDSRGSGAGK